MNEFRFHPFRVRYRYAHVIDQQRARILLLGGFAIWVISVAALALMLIRSTQDLPVLLTILSPVWIIIGVNVFLVQTGRLRIASALFIAALLVASGINLYKFGLGATTLVPFALGTVAAIAVLGVRSGAFFLVITVLMTLVALFVQQHGIIVRVYEPVGEVTYFLAYLVVITMIMALSTYRLEFALKDALHTAKRLSATAETSQAIVAYRSLDDLLRQTVALIREQFGLYHAQVFLLSEDGTQAVLRATTGRAGRRLLARGHRLEVGSRSVIGRVTLLNEPVLAAHTDPVHRPNPLLPDTRTELAVPLRIGDRVIGALDVQSVEENAFLPDDITSLQALANQLAVAVENTLLLEETRRQLAEKQHLLDQLQARLYEVERQNRQLTGETWARYLGARGADMLGFDWRGGQLNQESGWSPGMIAAMSDQRASLRQAGDRQVLTVPIVVRGRALGAVELVRIESNAWDEESVELAEQVVNRLALSLETARLTEDAQRLAERERLVSAMSAQLQGTQDMDDVLTLAAVEIRRALGAQATTVRLGGAKGMAAPEADA